MCLSVYVGASLPLATDEQVAVGGLKLAPATWTPPPLRRMAHVYYAGQYGHGQELGCSCFLSEQVRWDLTPPEIEDDYTYPDLGACPFDTLRRHCEYVLERGGTLVLTCDDSGGVEQKADEDDYHSAFVFSDQIKRGRLIFAEPNSGFPWRALVVLPANMAVRKADTATG